MQVFISYLRTFTSISHISTMSLVTCCFSYNLEDTVFSLVSGDFTLSFPIKEHKYFSSVSFDSTKLLWVVGTGSVFYSFFVFSLFYSPHNLF